MASELGLFKNWIEEQTGKTITDEAIDAAIEVYNKNRILLRQIYELRRMERSVVTGSEMMNIIFADQVMDKADMNVILEDFLKELGERKPGPDKIRLMLIGSETYDARLEELVESLGADIVVDELDNGSGYFWNNVIPMQDRMMAVGLRYLARPHSALKDNNMRRRPQRISELAEDYNIDGALVAKQVYCHSHGSDMYMVFKTLRERYIPYHYFERVNVLSKNETLSRIESFLSMIKPGISHIQGWHKKFGDE
jgi:benzoyl-CoA reductase subunit C